MPKDTFFNLPQEKRNRIIAGAKEAFSKKHYRQVTVDSIVAFSKIPKGSFYQYFANKNDLFKYIFRDIGIDKNKELMDEIEKSKDMKFSDLIIRLITRSNKFENQDEVMIGLKKRFLDECPQELRNEILLDVRPQTIDFFERIIGGYIKSGEFRDDFNINAAVFVFTSAVLNLDKYQMKNKNDYGELLKDICDILETGLKR